MEDSTVDAMLPIANPSDVVVRVMRENVPISDPRDDLRPVNRLSINAKTTAKNASSGISAMVLDIKYSKLVYWFRVRSRITTLRSFANKSSVFIRDICGVKPEHVEMK